MASAGEYTPVPAPYAWYPEFLNLVKTENPKFEFKCSNVGFETEKIQSCEVQNVGLTWYYTSKTFGDLLIYMGSKSGSLVEYKYCGGLGLATYINGIPFMGGFVSSTFSTIVDKKSNKALFVVDLFWAPINIDEAQKIHYTNTLVDFGGDLFINNINRKPEKKPKSKPIKPYVVMKINIPDHMRVKDEDYFIESWM
jgi:hypothetical protein